METQKKPTLCIMTPERIVSHVQYFSDHTDSEILEILEDALLDDVWCEIGDRYPIILTMDYPLLKQLLEERGFVKVSEESHTKKFFMKDAHMLSIDLPKGFVKIYKGREYFLHLENCNPEFIADLLSEYFEQLECLPAMFAECVKEGREKALAEKIACPLLKERIESSGVLDGYEHSVEYQNGHTILSITDVAHTNAVSHSWYELRVNEGNIEDIISRLPGAMADFEQFEAIFPEAPYSSYYR